MRKASRTTRRSSATSRVARNKVARKSAPKKTPAKKAPVRTRAAGATLKGKAQEKVAALIRLGRERGYVTYDEILREFPTIEDNVTLLEEMYEKFSTAVEDMLSRTDSPHAPWVIVEATNRYYARIKVLETIISALETRLGLPSSLGPKARKRRKSEELQGAVNA